MNLADPQVSAGWRPSAALTRAGLLSAVLAVWAVLLGRPDLLVLATPFAVHAAVVLGRRPGRCPRADGRLAHPDVREGEGTTVGLRLAGCADVEHAVAFVEAQPFQHLDPPHGVVGAVPAADVVDLRVQLTSTRWGRSPAGGALAAATGPWAGLQWGPHQVPPSTLTTLPLPGAFDSRAPSPHPIGLVGTHQARRSGQGNELADIRPFRPGDRLRRIHWRQTARTDTLHVTGTVAEEDTSVMLVLDAGTEVGASGGIRGSASTLDVTVRAAGALAEHYLHRGDRVGMRVLGDPGRADVPVSGGRRHLRRILDSLARVTPGKGRHAADPRRSRFRAPAGAVVLVLSPMLSDAVVTWTVALSRGGLTVVVVDTMPEDADIDLPDAPSDRRRRLAWRMRLLERDLLLGRVARAGVPVVPWRGPGTLDVVLRGLSRRARSPRVRAR